MNVIGIILTMFSFICLFIGLAIDEKYSFLKLFLGYVSGIFIIISALFLSTIKIGKSDLKVTTEKEPTIEQVIHFDSENNSDTTYYYYFKNSEAEEMR